MIDERKTVKACIIDDDAIFVYGFRKFMQIRGIFAEILEFNNGLEAINYLKNPLCADKLPDVIFVDINMPVMGGWEFLEIFEENQSQMGKNIAVYVISSSVDTNDISKSKNNSVIIDYILKPVSESHIEDIINSYHPALTLSYEN